MLCMASINPNDAAILAILVIGFIPAILSCLDLYIKGRKAEGGKLDVF